MFACTLGPQGPQLCAYNPTAVGGLQGSKLGATWVEIGTRCASAAATRQEVLPW